jgi:hypothetical protein
MTYYSRKNRIESRKNKRSAFLYAFLTIAVVSLFFFYGLPAVAKFAAFLTDLRQSSETVESTDTTPPPPPKFKSLPGATNKEKVEITGNTEPGATVEILVNNSEKEVLTDKNGEFLFEVDLKEGKNTISAIAVDKAGNESIRSKEVAINFDNEPPSLEITKPNDGNEYYGAQQRQIVIEGKTDENASVNINGRIVVVSSDGSFAFATTLSEGENEFTIKSQDEAGNEEEKTIKVNYHP